MPARTKAERDAALDELKSRAEQYLTLEIQRIDTETKFLRSVLQGRGAANAAALNMTSLSSLVQREIDDFLKAR